MGNGIGTAGNDETRSDVWIQVERRTEGGLQLDLTSKVEPYYGQAIREQVTETLEQMGVVHADVQVRDQGALPFAIQARVEAAASQAGYCGKKPQLPEAAPLSEPSPKDRLRRSRLYLPGNDPKIMIGAGLHGADGIILDLEDSVHPDAKSAARHMVRNALRCVDFGNAERMVRINPEPMAIQDLEMVVPARPDMILIPKVETADQVARVDGMVNRILGETGEHRPIWLMPILETALGMENAFEIAKASGRVAALTIGLEDYTADLGVEKTRDGAESNWARRRMVNAAVAAHVQPIDSVYGDVGDEEGLRSWGIRSRALGFTGMGCVHPRQIRVVHEAYSPSEARIEKALKIVAAFAKAQEAGLAVVSLGSKMIDPPVVERARRLVNDARRAGILPKLDDGSQE
jgi:citrate lyase subunit beta/citryl-CoA lyase